MASGSSNTVQHQHGTGIFNQRASNNANMWLSKQMLIIKRCLSVSFTLSSSCSLFSDSVCVFSFLFYLHMYDVANSEVFHVRESEVSRKQWVVCDLWLSSVYLRIQGGIRGGTLGFKPLIYSCWLHSLKAERKVYWACDWLALCVNTNHWQIGI